MTHSGDPVTASTSAGPGATSCVAATVRVAGHLALRNLRNVRRRPSTFVPALVMPVFFLIAFSGQFRGITELPGFPTRDALTWYAPLAVMMGALFSGIGAAQTTATEIENRFIDRLLLAPAPRPALILGTLLSGTVRVTIVVGIVLTVALVGGADVAGGPVGPLLLWGTALGVSMVATLWGLGVVYRLQTQNAGPIVQVVAFLAMFLSNANMPVRLLTGWVHAVARVNPMSNVLRMARSGFVSTVAWDVVWPGLAAGVALVLLLAAFAATGLRRLVP